MRRAGTWEPLRWRAVAALLAIVTTAGLMASLLTRSARRQGRCYAVTATACVVVSANALVVGQLPFAHTI